MSTLKFGTGALDDDGAAAPHEMITSDAGARSKPAIVFVVGAIAPYSNRLLDALARDTGWNVTVLACTALEPQRQWQIAPARDYRLVMLRGLSWHRSYTSHVYFNPGVLWELARGRPAAVVIDGFSPTMALAGLWALCNRIPLGISTDGSRSTDPGRTSRVHRALRRAFVPRAQFGIGASESSRELLASYGLSRERCAVVPIVSAWDPPQQRNPFDKRPFDLLFCGALNEDIKGALFFAETVERLQAGRREPLAVRVAGDGPDRSEMLTRLERAGARVRFDGFLDQDQLVEAYGSAKLLAFPSRGDAWGLVANEAVQCGTPVIGSPHAVSSLELVDRFGAGCLVPLDSAAWVEAISDVLAKRTRWESMHENCRRAVESFSVATSVARMKSALTPFLG